MDRTTDTPQEPTISSNRSKSAGVLTRKKMQRTRSFTDALRDKYCNQEDCQSEFIIDIVIRGKPKNNGPTSAELAHLRNVVLSNSRVSTGGLPDKGLSSLCPNVTDLDLSSNLLESWAELLPLLSELPHLKFLNLSRNHITRHKEELWRWNTPLPKVENMVLNSTGIPLREVLALARLMPALRELHICCNYYRDLGSVEVAIKDGALYRLECLRLNENIITSWSEVWKLRSLPCLTQLILSENPLCDVFYSMADSHLLEETMFEMDSPDITCHSDGEESSSFGSPHFRYTMMKMAEASAHRVGTLDSTHVSVQAYSQTQSAPQLSSHLSSHPTTTSNTTTATTTIPTTSISRNTTTTATTTITTTRDQCHMIHDLIDDLITSVCRSMAAQESCEGCGEDGGRVEGFHRFHHNICVDDDDDDSCGDARPKFFLDDLERERCDGDDEENEDGGGRRRRETSSSDADEEGVTMAMDEGDRLAVRGDDEEEEEEEEEEEAALSVQTGESIPFAKLHTLCLSRTSICDVEHLHALNDFPALHSLKVMDIALFSHLRQEDRRKLYVASLPAVSILNGSEVTITEREKAERFYLRHFLDQEDKPPRYSELERKHGPIQPLFDIDLGARFQTEATITVVLCGSEQFTESVSLLQPVEKLRRYLAERLAIPRSSFRMFHLACGPHQDPEDRAFDELFLDSLPLSRFDFMDGDELHLDFLTGESASPTLSGIRF